MINSKGGLKTKNTIFWITDSALLFISFYDYIYTAIHDYDGRGRPEAIKDVCLPKPLLTLKGTPDKSACGKPLNELAITAAAQLDHFCHAKKNLRQCSLSLLLLTHLRRFLRGFLGDLKSKADTQNS